MEYLHLDRWGAFGVITGNQEILTLQLMSILVRVHVANDMRTFWNDSRSIGPNDLGDVGS